MGYAGTAVNSQDSSVIRLGSDWPRHYRRVGACIFPRCSRRARAVTRISAAHVSPWSYFSCTIRSGWQHGLIQRGLGGESTQLFSMRLDTTESRSEGVPNARILAISSSWQLAVLLRGHLVNCNITRGTLARAPFGSGGLREILQDVQEADWTPDATALAIIRDAGGRSRLEFPIGKSLYETGGYLSHLRVSPRGDKAAFIEHPIREDDAGSVVVIDSAGTKTTISSGWNSVDGLAWSRNGDPDEIWFTAAKVGMARALYAGSLSGKLRLIARVPGALILQDISSDGRVLITHDIWRLGIYVLAPGETVERDLSLFEWSLASDISSDGKTLLITESGEGEGSNYGVYLRKIDGSPAIRLGEGIATALTPDGKWALSMPRTSLPRLILLPTGAGQAKRLELDPMSHQWVSCLPDGQRILIWGNEPGRGRRLYVRDLAGGKLQPITPEGTNIPWAISPDGKFVAAFTDPDQLVSLYPILGGEPRPVPSLTPGDAPIGWGADNRTLYVSPRGDLPPKIFSVDPKTGRRHFIRQAMPPDPVGIRCVPRILTTSDARSYAYTYFRDLSDLYVVDGLK